MIHLFQVGSTRMVLDVASGVVHEIDQVAWDVLSVYQEAQNKSPLEVQQYINEKLQHKYTSQVLEELIGEIEALKEEGLLFSEDPVISYSPGNDSIVKALCLHIAHDCNMRCRYCFASTGDFGGPREIMTSEVGRQAIDFLIQHSANRKHLEIDFFGGEPLLGFEVVKELVKYGRKQAAEHGKVMRFTLTTNGVNLDDEVVDYLNRNSISVVLSLDGRKSVHDKMRPLVGGQPSYERIVPRFQQLASGREHRDYYIRGTFTAYNLDFTADVQHMLDLGFKHVSVEPVVAPADRDYAIKQEHLPRIFEEYEKLAELYLERHRQGQPFTFFHFDIDLEQGPCLAKRLTGCGAGFDYLAVAPNGDLYPCHQFVGTEGFKLGHVSEPDQLNRELQRRFMEAHVYNKEKCRDCWAKYYCSGGCHANAYFANGDILEPEEISCALQKKRIECALALKAQLVREEN